MWRVFNDFGQVAEFETKEKAQDLVDEENEHEPNSHWLVYISWL